MLVTLKNDQLEVTINSLGAELTKIYKPQTKIDYLWHGDAKYWGRHAPVLFPFVGRLKDDTYYYEKQSFHQSQHGFARDQEFELLVQSDTKASFLLESSAKTLAVYPFEFKLVITYELKADQVLVSYQVENPGQKDLLFALGAHPAFNIPLVAGDTFENSNLKVSPAKVYPQIKLRGPYSDPENKEKLELTEPLALDHELFAEDALILDLQGQEATLSLEGPSGHGVAVTLTQTPFVGVWSPYPKQAPFVCVEPWWGLADTVTSDQDLKHKFAINTLASGQMWQQSYAMSFY